MFSKLHKKILSHGPIPDILAIIIVCLTGIIIYSNTFQSPFVFDDTKIIEQNAIKNITNLNALWQLDPTHFVTYLSLAFNYHFHKLRVWGYHLVNIVVHIATALLVWWLLTLTFNTVSLKDKEIDCRNRWLALFSALLFISHPIQTEAVTYIIQRATSLATFFYVGSLTLYVKAKLLLNKNFSSGVWKIYYGLSLLFALLGMFSKQIVFTLPLMIVLYEFCFLKEEKSKNINWKYSIPFLLLLLIVPLNVAAAKKTALWHVVELTKESDIVPRGRYLLTQFRVIVTYLRLLFIPLNQNIDYDYRVSESLAEPSTSITFLLLIFILSTSILLFKRYRLISFSIFWFFITLSVESSLIPIQDVIFEHRLYLPMVGYSIFIPVVLYLFCCYRNRRLKIAISIFIMLVCIYSILTYNRNRVWSSEIDLWTDTVKKSPSKARGYNNLGFAYFSMGREKEAIISYQKAIEIDPNCAQAYNNLGLAYFNTGKKEEAVILYRKAIEINPDYAEAYNNLGNSYSRIGREEEGVLLYKKAIEINPGYAEAFYNLGTAYFHIDKKEEAIISYRKAIEINPDYTTAYYNLGGVYYSMGRGKEAIRLYEKIIEIDPSYQEVYNNIAKAYYIDKQYDVAIKYCDRMIALGYKVDHEFLKLIEPYRK